MPTQVNRLVGKYAVCTVGGLLVAQLTDWSAEINTIFEDGTAFGDYWEIPIILRNSWSGRIRGFLTEASRLSFLSAYRFDAAGVIATEDATPPITTPYADQLAVTFIGYNDYASLADSKRLLKGDIYIGTASINLPEGMADQELLFRGIGAPHYIGNSTN